MADPYDESPSPDSLTSYTKWLTTKVEDWGSIPESKAIEFLEDETIPLSHRISIADVFFSRYSNYQDVTMPWLFERQFGLDLTRSIQRCLPVRWEWLPYIANNSSLFQKSTEAEEQNPTVLYVNSMRITTHRPISDIFTIELLFLRKGLDATQLAEILKLSNETNELSADWTNRLFKLGMRVHRKTDEDFSAVNNWLGARIKKNLDIPQELPNDWLLTLM